MKYVIIALTFAYCVNVQAQEKAYPVFVTDQMHEWFLKESNTYKDKLKELNKAFQNNSSNLSILEIQSQVKQSLDRLSNNSKFIEMDLTNQLDLEKIKREKQEIQDGEGFVYYVKVERNRKSPFRVEISMTPSQLQQFSDNLKELKEIGSQYAIAVNTQDRSAAVAEKLDMASNIISETEGLLAAKK